MQRSLITAIAMTSALLSCAPAFAQEVTQSLHIRYSDLNLASASGAAALHHRIAGAVDEVCGEADNRNINAASGNYKCRADAQADAEMQMSKSIAAARAKAPLQTASNGLSGQ